MIAVLIFVRSDIPLRRNKDFILSIRAIEETIRICIRHTDGRFVVLKPAVRSLNEII